MTLAELDALPTGTRLREQELNGALWIKHRDGSWHLTEQEDGWASTGFDWSGPDGDTSETVVRGAHDGAWLSAV